MEFSHLLMNKISCWSLADDTKKEMSENTKEEKEAVSNGIIAST